MVEELCVPPLLLLRGQDPAVASERRRLRVLEVMKVLLVLKLSIRGRAAAIGGAVGRVGGRTLPASGKGK